MSQRFSLSYFKSWFMPGSFLRHLLTMMSGSSLAQVLTVISAPVLSRIFSPEIFGGFALFTSITSITIVLATGRYEIAILLPKEDKEAINLGLLTLSLCTFFSFVLMGVVILFHTGINSLLKQKQESAWIYAIPASIFIMGIYQVFYYWSNRKKLYKKMALSRISQSAVNPLTGISMGLMNLGIWGLIGGQILSFFSAVLVLSKSFLHESRKKENRTSIGGILKTAAQYKNFPLHNIPSTTLNTLGFQLPLILLGTFYGPRILGFYYFTYRLINLPMNVIGTSLSDVFYRRSLDFMENGEKLKANMEKAVASLFLLSLIPVLVIILFGNHLFSLIFSVQWKTAGVYAQAMVPFFLLRFLSSPLTLFYQKGKTLLLLIWQAVFFGGIVISLCAGKAFFSPMATITFISLTGSICYLWLLHLNLRMSGSSLKNLTTAIFHTCKEILHAKKTL